MNRPRKSFKNFFSFKSFSFRSFFILASLILAINILASRYFQLQISRHKDLYAMATSQQFKLFKLDPERGEILARDKSNNLHHLAISKNKYTLTANGQEIASSKISPIKISGTLSEILDLESSKILPKLINSNDPYEIIQKDVPEEIAEKIETLELPGIHFDIDRYRYYPLKNLASHLLGFVGHDEDGNLSGRYGLELGFDDLLNGQGSSKEAASSLLEKGTILGVASLYRRDGDSLYLTIDPVIQNEAERLLEEEVTNQSAKSGNLIIMDPKTGQIIALAGYPDFDPNNFSKEKDLGVFLNSAVSLRYEPGSVFKVFTMAAGLESGKIRPDSEYYDGGEVIINGRTIRNAGNSAPKVKVSMQLFLQRSYNLGAVYIQKTIGNPFFKDFILKKLDFEEKTEIDLPQEISSSFKNLYSSESKDINFATASFGQGVAVTPIKLLQEFSAFGNKGVMMKPYVVKEIVSKDGRQKEIKPESAGRIVSEETVEELLPLLEGVVSGERGSGKLAAIKGYRIAGKTGTGEIPLENGRGYSEQVNHSFLGLAPISDPKFVVLTRIEDPKGARYAEATAVPLFRKIMKFVLDYYAVPPDKPEELVKP